MLALVVLAVSLFGSPVQTETPAPRPDYCEVETQGQKLEVVRPSLDESSIDDVNWFARPLPNDRREWIIAFASHDQNYLYNLSTGSRVKIPDRSDAVATPDGRYMTVPSNYTADQTTHFYDASVLLDHLDRGIDADRVAPVYIHRHPELRKVFYQSAGVVSDDVVGDSRRTTYRLMFSGTRDEAQFRIVDYEFVEERATGVLTVTPSEPMRLCPEIPNDLNTPFISKDARYVVSYTSSYDKRVYTPGSSLKIFRILDVYPEKATTACEEVLDFGFAAGKADFSFDNSMLTFHISKGGYLTPFISGGLDSPTITDVVVAKLSKDAMGRIDGVQDIARVTTSLTEGVGSYFPAFFQDGRLFYLFNVEPKGSEGEKRFYFKVVDPKAELAMSSFFADERKTRFARAIGELWASACGAGTPAVHEAPWTIASLTKAQCLALVADAWREGLPPRHDLESICSLRR